MRRIVLIVPDLLGDPSAESPLRQRLPALRSLTEIGRIKRLNPPAKVETPEALLLGMSPNEGQLRQGPLTVSALGFDPPDRSIHFHGSLLDLNDDHLAPINEPLTREEEDSVWNALMRLSTPTLTLLRGEGIDHGLVWEGRGDFGTTSQSDALGKRLKECLPEGDAETILRRLIDDSVNVLNELEFNDRRRDEGKSIVNLFWPWGHGVRQRVPNLALQRGEVAHVESASIRLQGLTRLTGYRHGDRHAVGVRTATRFETLADHSHRQDLNIIFLTGATELRAQRAEEELHWFIREFDQKLLTPIMERFAGQAGRLSLISPSAGGLGLSLTVEFPSSTLQVYPFDERTLDERTISISDLNSEVATALSL